MFPIIGPVWLFPFIPRARKTFCRYENQFLATEVCPIPQTDRVFDRDEGRLDRHEATWPPLKEQSVVKCG
ncbi:hypothetical protein ACVIKP_006771 [Rhizobium leguminosarum]